MSDVVDLRTSSLDKAVEPTSNLIDLFDVEPYRVSRRLRETLGIIKANILFVRSGAPLTDPPAIA